MRSARKRMQKGSFRRVPRAKGNWDWEFRYLNPQTGESESKYFSGGRFPEKSDIERHLVPFLARLNSVDANEIILDPTVGDVLNEFIAEENIEEILKRKPGERAANKDELSFSTCTSYRSLLNKIRDRWGGVKVDEFSPAEFQKWLKQETLAPKTKGHVKNFTQRLFNKAKLYGMFNFVENPIKLVEVRGISKRRKSPTSLSIEQFYLVADLLPEPYRTMAIIAQCTGLRSEEVLALFWSDIDFDEMTMMVTRAAVHGRISWVKTEYSEDALPLDKKFVEVLKNLKEKSGGTELLFPSPKTGHCYHASPIQQDYIRRAGWCLVKCPVCNAEPGSSCNIVLKGKGSLPAIPVHDERRELATTKKLGSIGWHTFRHTYSTLLKGVEAPMEVQQALMRHADITTTMNQYGETPMANRREANSKVVEIVFDRRSSSGDWSPKTETGAEGARAS